MPKFDERIDQYIAKSADFAQPILVHLRQIVVDTCPNVQETMKWSFPHFEYNGSILCSMASFKKHCSFGFWLGSLMEDPEKLFARNTGDSGMGDFGKITGFNDLPSESILRSYILQAMILIDKGVKLPKKALPPRQELIVPDYFLEALSQNFLAQETFDNFSYSNKKEYVNWLLEAQNREDKTFTFSHSHRMAS